MRANRKKTQAGRRSASSIHEFDEGSSRFRQRPKRAAIFAGRIVLGLGVVSIAASALTLAASVAFTSSKLPEAHDLLDNRIRGSVTMLDVHGEIFAWRGDQFSDLRNLSDVSQALLDAVIATEDRRFYRHYGIDPRGIASAIRINLLEGRGPFSGHGGSTITQQTAKLLCLGVSFNPTQWATETSYEEECRETTIWRKIREASFALALEARYTKDEILLIYLNRAYFGAGARGAEAASQRYFGIPASNLRPAEAALLAGLLRAPSYYAPTADLERSRNRAATVLGLMAAQGYLTVHELAAALNEPATLSESALHLSGEYFADWLMTTGPDFLTTKTMEDVTIQTTFDPRAQDAAEGAMAWAYNDQIDPASEVQVAVVVTSADGAVRAMVGGRQTGQIAGQFNRAVQASRQTGSAFKPFVYAAALELGYSPLNVVEDAPITIKMPGSVDWSPRNFSRSFRGQVTYLEALTKSLNTPVVRLSQEIGLDSVRAVASGFGIQSDLATGPALVLGVSGASLLEMTGAYAGFLNGGKAVDPYGVLELAIAGDSAPIFLHEVGLRDRVIGGNAAGQMIYMLREVIENGTGRRARIQGIDLAGKSGTTQSHRDAWFIGFSSEYVVGVWVGYDDNRPMAQVSGGGLPADIWRETMMRLHRGIEAHPLQAIPPSPPLWKIKEKEALDWQGVY